MLTDAQTPFLGTPLVPSRKESMSSPTRVHIPFVRPVGARDAWAAAEKDRARGEKHNLRWWITGGLALTGVILFLDDFREIGFLSLCVIYYLFALPIDCSDPPPHVSPPDPPHSHNRKAHADAVRGHLSKRGLTSAAFKRRGPNETG